MILNIFLWSGSRIRIRIRTEIFALIWIWIRIQIRKKNNADTANTPNTPTVANENEGEGGLLITAASLHHITTLSPSLDSPFSPLFLSLSFSLKKGQPTRFLPPICSQMDFYQAPQWVFKDFLNLASNSRRYLRFFIDSPLLFIVESQYSPYCLIRRVATLRFIREGSHYLLELSA